MSQKLVFDQLFDKKTAVKQPKKRSLTKKRFTKTAPKITRKVKLNKIDEISESASMAFGAIDMALEMFYEGREKIIGARDTFRFQLQDYGFYEAQEKLDALTEELEMLGVGPTSEMENAQENINSTIEKYNELHQEFENLGVNPMMDRL